METNQSLVHNKSGNGLINNLKASKQTTTDLNLAQHGDSILLPGRIHLRLHTGNKAAIGSEIEARIRGKHHPRLNSNIFFFVQRCHYACWKFNLLAIDGECRQTQLPRTTFSHAQLLHRRVSLSVRVYSHTLTSMHLHGSSHEAHCLHLAQNIHNSSSSRNVVHHAEPDTTHGHSLLTFS